MLIGVSVGSGYSCGLGDIRIQLLFMPLGLLLTLRLRSAPAWGVRGLVPGICMAIPIDQLSFLPQAQLGVQEKVLLEALQNVLCQECKELKRFCGGLPVAHTIMKQLAQAFSCHPVPRAFPNCADAFY